MRRASAELLSGAKMTLLGPEAGGGAVVYVFLGRRFVAKTLKRQNVKTSKRQNVTSF
jgi:hypothetical protein